jgi:hypothetical protein
MLHPAPPTSPAARLSTAPDGDGYRVLILDGATRDVIAPLLRVADLRRHGVTLHLQLAADAAAGTYDSMHLNFCGGIPPPLLARLAAATAAGPPAAISRIASVADQHLAFASLDAGLFSLRRPAAFRALHAPGAADAAIRAEIDAIVEGLHGVVATLGAVPLIRAAKGGPAEAVVRLDVQLTGEQTPGERGVEPPLLTGRVGLELNPLDRRDPEDLRWLLAWQWPEHHLRRERLLAALAGAPHHPVWRADANVLARATLPAAQPSSQRAAPNRSAMNATKAATAGASTAAFGRTA